MLPVISKYNNLVDWMDELFGKDLVPEFQWKTGVSMPAVNVVENSTEFIIEVAAPGLEKEDFKIDLEHNNLVISSEKEDKVEQSDAKFMRREFRYTSFKRSFLLPNSADREKISATHKNGILFITIPKKEEAKPKPPRKIEIG